MDELPCLLYYFNFHPLGLQLVEDAKEKLETSDNRVIHKFQEYLSLSLSLPLKILSNSARANFVLLTA